jgi:hypothetical protein
MAWARGLKGAAQQTALGGGARGPRPAHAMWWKPKDRAQPLGQARRPDGDGGRACAFLLLSKR